MTKTKVESKITKTVSSFIDTANKTIETVEQKVKKYSEGPKKILTDVIEFLKKHKKLLIGLGILLVVGNYLLGDPKITEEVEEVEEEDGEDEN
jgi:hypothetical protein